MKILSKIFTLYHPTTALVFYQTKKKKKLMWKHLIWIKGNQSIALIPLIERKQKH